jgi:hypothetical protein
MQLSICRAKRQQQLEAAARTTIEERADRKLTDAEWATVRIRLLEFAGILRAWDQTKSVPGRGKVKELWQREP